MTQYKKEILGRLFLMFTNIRCGLRSQTSSYLETSLAKVFPDEFPFYSEIWLHIQNPRGESNLGSIILNPQEDYPALDHYKQTQPHVSI